MPVNQRIGVSIHPDPVAVAPLEHLGDSKVPPHGLLDRASAAGVAIWPSEVVNREPWLVGHARWRGSGERHDVAMEVRLVGVAAVGRYAGYGFTGG